MIGLDTNILLRWLIDDGGSREEAELAAGVLTGPDLHLSSIAFAETIWVLQNTYKRPADEVVSIVQGLLDASNLTIESREQVTRALASFADRHGDFSDHLIGTHDLLAGCSHTLTFDKKAARGAPFKLLGRRQSSSKTGH